MISESVLRHTEVLFGLGVEDNWQFEQEFKNRSGCQVVCFDHTVTSAFWRNRLVWDFLAFMCGKRLTPKSIRGMFKYFDYRKFFDGRSAIHHQTKIGYASDRSRDVRQLLALAGDRKVFLKIDIEGSEYRILDQLLEYPERVVGYVIEFHDLDLHRERVSMFVKSAEKNYVLIHIHGNNCGDTDPDGDPLALEITWVRKDLFTPSHEIAGRFYPVAGLDYPNNPQAKDIPLRFMGEDR